MHRGLRTASGAWLSDLLGRRENIGRQGRSRARWGRLKALMAFNHCTTLRQRTRTKRCYASAQTGPLGAGELKEAQAGERRIGEGPVAWDVEEFDVREQRGSITLKPEVRSVFAHRAGSRGTMSSL